MNTPQPRTAAPLDFPRIDLDLADDRQRRFEVIHGGRETVIKVHGDAMAQLNAEASSLTLDDDAERRRLALLIAPSPRHTREQARRRAAEARARQRADAEATANARRWYLEQLQRDRAAALAARSGGLVFADHAPERIPPTGPVRIRARARRDRVVTVATASATAALFGVLGLLAYVARL